MKKANYDIKNSNQNRYTKKKKLIEKTIQKKGLSESELMNATALEFDLSAATNN